MSDELDILWHAGEPLLAGIEFYKRALDLFDKWNHSQIRITQNIQTNGTVVDEKWASFLAANSFKVGVSIDGPADLHDRQRTRWSGSGSHATVMRGVKILREHGLSPGALCVLTADSLRRPKEMLDFFLEAGFQSVAFNVEEAENAHPVSSLGEPDKLALYERFLRSFLEHWWPHRKHLKVREFDDLGQILSAYRNNPAYRRPVVETQPLGILTVTKTGDIFTFSPEFAGSVAPEFDNFVVGNIEEIDEISDILKDPRFKRLAYEVAYGQSLCSATCTYYPVCGGGFFSNRYAEHGTLRVAETRTCLLHRQILTDTVLQTLEIRASSS